jgi:type IV pilus assembly protein PilB
MGDFADGLVRDDEPTDLEALESVVDDAPIVKFVNALISQAVRDRASDIHIEPGEKEVRVRYRVDGVLHEVMQQSSRIHPSVVSRLKIMADLDIAERRIPQDGRISLRTGGKQIDLRLSTLPTVYGEKVVMRILDASSVVLELSDLGFMDHNYARFESSFTKPYGMILVTGPTGSGKSTTLYATLNVINKPEVNIVTTEDPVEYRLPGINQVQINVKAGLTFPAALRSILRQDPDVVLVGEMRDHETAHIGMEAALTGHLVLSTLHTNDAPSAVTRLTEMKIDPFLVASAVDCVLAQRLVRKLCGKCKEPYEPSPEELKVAGLPWGDQDALPTLFRAVGCSSCAKTGYRGRVAVHEVMLVTEEIERLIVERASTDEIAKFASAQGMRTLREDGLAKVLLGRTTLEEVARVVV